MDLMPSKQQILVGTALNFWDSIVPVLYTIYYWEISKNWLWFVIIFAEAAGVIVISLTFMLPESPRYLVSQKLYDEARVSINFFVPKNSPLKFVGKFDREVLDHTSFPETQRHSAGLNYSNSASTIEIPNNLILSVPPTPIIERKKAIEE